MKRRSFIKSLVASFFIASAVGLERALGEPDEIEEPTAQIFYLDGMGETLGLIEGEVFLESESGSRLMAMNTPEGMALVSEIGAPEIFLSTKSELFHIGYMPKDWGRPS